MHRYVIKRILMMIPVLIGVSFLVFLILAVSPGDPTRMILGQQASEEAIVAMREELGLNNNLFVRYFDYMADVLQGDFGVSWKTKLEVLPQVLGYFPNTLILSLAGILVAMLIGVPIGILSAKKQYTWIDNVTTVLGLIGVAMPNFWFGLLLVMLFSVTLGWLPSSGMGEGVALLPSLILPALTLGTGCAASIMRMTRSSMLESMRQDYIDTARSKGLKEGYITRVHMFKNALIPIVIRDRASVRYASWRRGFDRDYFLLAGARTIYDRIHQGEGHAYGTGVSHVSGADIFCGKSAG